MDTEKLARVWFHSHEEGEGDRIVYRSQSYDFPRSRTPRDSLNIQPEGTVGLGEPGPADASIYRQGAWTLASDVLTLSGPGGPTEYQIESVDDEKLVLRRLR